MTEAGFLTDLGVPLFQETSIWIQHNTTVAPNCLPAPSTLLDGQAGSCQELLDTWSQCGQILSGYGLC